MVEIIKPNGGKPKKIVNMRNEPIESQANDTPESVREMSPKERMVHALRRFTSDIENAPDDHVPEYILLLPRFKTGQMPLMLLGVDMPQTMLVGVLHKLVTRMSLEG